MNYFPSRNDPMDAHNDEVGQPTKYPVHRYDFKDNDFTNDQRAWIGTGFAMMSALGPTAVRYVDGTAKIIVAHWPDFDTSTTPNAGRTKWLPNGDILIELDPVGLHGELSFIAGAAHEMGHVFNNSREHVPASVGPAIMNPTISEVDFVPLPVGDDPTGNTMGGSPPPRAPTVWDRDLFDRS